MQWTSFFQDLEGQILRDLQTMVEFETPSHDKPALDSLGHWLRCQFEQAGCTVSTIPMARAGDILRAEYGEGEEQILVLGHFDTVKPVGTLATEPWRIEDGRAYGPGIYDMKAGIVFCLHALRAMEKQRVSPGKKIVMLWTTDEELGSPNSAETIVAEAKKSALCLVLEPAHPSGALKTARKSGGEFTLKVRGIAAHAGNDHAQGRNAIIELCQQLITIQAWTDYDLGTTLSAGLVSGGTAVNVVPAYAEASVDVRVSTQAEGKRISELIQSLKPKTEGCTIEVIGGLDKPPLERTDATARLFAIAEREAKQEGFTLSEISVGGTSDGNTAAAAGIPVLDGLGPVGDGAHARDEHVVVSSLAPRTALLLRLLTTL